MGRGGGEVGGRGGAHGEQPSSVQSGGTTAQSIEPAGAGGQRAPDGASSARAAAAAAAASVARSSIMSEGRWLLAGAGLAEQGRATAGETRLEEGALGGCSMANEVVGSGRVLVKH